MTTMHGVKIPKLKPGTPDWASKMSASKVGAMLGLSPFESRYALWQRMAGHIPWEVDSDILRRGHYIEPALGQWWQDQHMSLAVEPTSAFHHPDRPDHVASPDFLVKARNVERSITALLEGKTANNEWEWGAEGSDEIPPGYKAQALWQLYVTGLPVCHFSVLTPYMEFRQFTVNRDDDDIAFIVDEADRFMASIAADQAPDLDDTDHTYQAIRQLHPQIDGTTVDLDPDVAVAWIHAKQQEAAAAREVSAARNRIADAMGNAQKALFAGTTYATRQTRGGCTPFVVVGRGLIAKEESAAA